MASPILALAPLLALALSGCGKSQWPDVSQENCKPINTMRIKDPSWRADFMKFCSSIPRTAWPIQPLDWLALSHQERGIFLEQAALAPNLGDTANPPDWLSIKP